MTVPTRHGWGFWWAGRVRTVALLAFAARCPPAFAQDRPTTFGIEIAVKSGHADRGFIISDRPVVQPVAWVSGRVAEFSVWGNLSLAETTDRSRPRILEMELTREHERRHFRIAPALRMFFYHDPLSIYSTHSIEGWLYLSYRAGPLRLFTNHSLDVLTYRGAYYEKPASNRSSGCHGDSRSEAQWPSAGRLRGSTMLMPMSPHRRSIA